VYESKRSIRIIKNNKRNITVKEKLKKLKRQLVKIVKLSFKSKIRGLSKDNFQYLNELCKHSKNLYNQALYIIRQDFNSENKTYLNYNKIDKIMKITKNLENEIKDYLHKASTKIVKECVKNKISTVVIGDVAKSNNKINLGKRTNQNFVNISLGQFIEKLKYKLELHNIKVKVNDESYTSKASFIDNDELPKKYTPNKRYTFSGKRVKRGLYKPLNKVFQKVNADCNGAYNIIRKVVPKFSFEDLSKKVNDGIAGWFLPHIKIIDSSIKVNVK